MGGESIGKIIPQHQADAGFTAQQLMLMLGVLKEIREQSDGLQAAVLTPVSVQKANLLRDTNGGSTAVRDPRSQRARPGDDELPSSIPSLLFLYSLYWASNRAILGRSC